METDGNRAWSQVDQQDVRPYMVTGGRTRPRHTMRLVSLLAPGSSPPADPLPPEAEQAVALCRDEPRSVAELAGHLGLPVQVTKVILSDLLDADVLSIQISETSPSRDVNALEALLVGLRKKFPDAA
ncbi:hypothetical protein AQ490_06900 [Wenjunlia vitaminophila]|uniref:DUF742 domain-containing protein n=1 Tax=Wenjunlia vitaminophila TaxID=76728 RepID=A0A0T6LND0_WENVI|nr:DUF742 domain-containing protein [Wenjunlia vitaminophila]KRV47614.1 hypothetical protein AQ490_06900 [Wenjunlia vitaminophila]